MVLGEETLRPLRQLGIPPTTVLSGPLCGARKSAAGSVRGIPRGTEKACGSHFPGPLLLFQGARPSAAPAKRAELRSIYRDSVPNASWGLFPPLPLLFCCRSRKPAFSLLAESY